MIESLIKTSCAALGWGVSLWIIGTLVEDLAHQKTIAFLISILAVMCISCGLAEIIMFISAGIIIAVVVCFI